MSVMGKPSHRRDLGPPSSQPDERLAAASYFGAIIIVPIVPLVIYLTRRHASPYVRQHAAQALNVALTCLLYVTSAVIIGGLLALDSVLSALIITLLIFAIGWAIMLTYLVLGARSASRGEFRRIPNWICAPLVT